MPVLPPPPPPFFLWMSVLLGDELYNLSGFFSRLFLENWNYAPPVVFRLHSLPVCFWIWGHIPPLLVEKKPLSVLISYSIHFSDLGRPKQIVWNKAAILPGLDEKLLFGLPLYKWTANLHRLAPVLPIHYGYSNEVQRNSRINCGRHVSRNFKCCCLGLLP